MYSNRADVFVYAFVIPSARGLEMVIKWDIGGVLETGGVVVTADSSFPLFSFPQGREKQAELCLSQPQVQVCYGPNCDSA